MLALTNSPISGSDGTGAQLVRYATLYSLSRKYKIPWVHSPIVKIDSNPGDGMQNSESITDFLNELNVFLLKPENVNEFPNSVSKFSIKKSLSKSNLQFLLQSVSTLSRIYPPILALTLNHPQSYLQYFRDLLVYFSNDYALTKFKSPKNESKSIQIHLHIRGAFHNDRNLDPTLMLSLLHLIQKEVLSRNLGVQITIHTDIPESSQTWDVPDGQDPGTLHYWNSMGVLNANNSLQLKEFDFSTWESVLGKVLILRNLNPLVSWKEMAQADILIGCHSSFSLMGALLNSSALILVPSEIKVMSHWHEFDSSFTNFQSLSVAVYDYISKIRNI
jgi:hypothetical protein